MAISEASPRRGPSLMMRVYPPGRSLKRGPMVSNSLATSVSSWICDPARRRACTESFLPRVMRRSICGRSSFAFGKVVTMRSLSMSDASWLRNMARRCPDVRPSLRWVIPCLITLYLSKSKGRRRAGPCSLLVHRSAARTAGHAGHAERQSERSENVFDLIERRAAKVLGRKHLTLGALNEIAERADVGVLEAVRGADRKVELLDRLGQHLGHARIDLGSGGLLDLLAAGLERTEDTEVIAEKLGREADRLLRRDGAVGPDFEHELVVVGGLADARAFHVIVHAAHRRMDRVDRNVAEREVGVGVTVGDLVAAAALQTRLEFERAFLGKRRDVCRRVEDLDVGVLFEVGGGDDTGALLLEVERLRTFAVELERNLFEVEDDVGHVLDHTLE